MTGERTRDGEWERGREGGMQRPRLRGGNGRPDDSEKDLASEWKGQRGGEELQRGLETTTAFVGAVALSVCSET